MLLLVLVVNLSRKPISLLPFVTIECNGFAPAYESNYNMQVVRDITLDKSVAFARKHLFGFDTLLCAFNTKH